MCTTRPAWCPYCSHLSGLLLALLHTSCGHVSLNIPGPLVPRKLRRSTWKALSRQRCQPERGKDEGGWNPLMNDDSLATSVHYLAPLAREQFVVAIDFGGTKIAVATADMTGSILKQARLDTNAARGCFAIAQAQFFSLRQGDSFAFEQVEFRGLPFYHTLLHS